MYIDLEITAQKRYHVKYKFEREVIDLLNQGVNPKEMDKSFFHTIDVQDTFIQPTGSYEAFDHQDQSIYKSEPRQGDTFGGNWCFDDIIQRAKEEDISLKYEDAKVIAETIERTHDATIGINWDVIDDAIKQYIIDKEH
jgi:hypothetical protein